MHRRGGIRGLRARKERRDRAEDKGDELGAEKLEHLQKQMKIFKEKLEVFAREHKKDINSNPQFRHYFHQMCSNIGVDPLASSKGFWAELLGVGDFYFELGIQIVEQCLITRKFNGGLMEIGDLLARIQKKKKNTKISVEDLETAISKLRKLGSEFGIVRLGNKRVVKSVPVELNRDHHQVLEAAEKTASLTVKEACNNLKWPKHRVKSVLGIMLEEGMSWIDQQDESGEVRFWFPCLFDEQLF